MNPSYNILGHDMTLLTQINDVAIFRCPPGFVLKGIPDGVAYKWQFYLRRLITRQDSLRDIATQFNLIVDDWTRANGPIQLAGLESAGPPIISAMSMLSTNPLVNYFFIRKSPKEYGLLNTIEGRCQHGTPVILVDDISNSKNTLMNAKKVCKNLNLNVIGGLTIVDKHNSTVDEKSQMPICSLFNISNFKLTWEDYFGSDDISEIIPILVKEYQYALWFKVDEMTVVNVHSQISKMRDQSSMSEDDAILTIINKIQESTF